MLPSNLVLQPWWGNALHTRSETQSSESEQGQVRKRFAHLTLMCVRIHALICLKLCSSVAVSSDEGYCWSDVRLALCEGDLSSSEGAHQEVTANCI